MKILFTGDVNFRGIEILDAKKSEEALCEIKPFIDKVDFCIPNLETPLADKEKHTPIYKSGPNLVCLPGNITFLKTMNADGVTLANNHMGDYGEGAVKDTLSILNENNILHAGAGANIYKAYKALRLEKDGKSVAIISVCENEFGMATETTYGSAGYEPRLLLKQIKIEKETADFVVVVFHGGNEFNPLPSPDTVARYRLVCDMGADAVIGGHTHCPQGYEYYDGKPIVYSMGNFLFQNVNKPNPNDSWYYGYISILEIEESISLKILPYKFDKKATRVSVFQGKEQDKMMEYIRCLSDIIQNSAELSAYFKGWAWNHQWIPGLPKDLNDLEGYSFAPNYDLVSCESHFSQMKEVFRVLFNGEMEIAKEYAKRIEKLQEMPV